jgi:molecular chaperone GrpE
LNGSTFASPKTKGIDMEETKIETPQSQDPQPEETPVQETEALKQALEEQKDKYLRLFAEYDNFKKRTYREKLETIQTAGKDIIVSLLDILDDCERAEKQMAASEIREEDKAGTLLIFNRLRNTLQQRGLKSFDSIGETFNTDLHEAISEIDAGPDKKGIIIEELMKGYTLHDKIIRFSKVVVGR